MYKFQLSDHLNQLLHLGNYFVQQNRSENMKILIPTYIHPSENSYANIYLKNIIKNLEKKTDVTCIWFLCHPQKLSKRDNYKEKIIDIHDSIDAIQVLKNLKPDCVINNNSKYDVISYSFSLAAKYLKIPLILYKTTDLDEAEHPRNFSQIKRNFIRNLRKITSTDYQIKGQKRSSFIIYKNMFLFKTKKKIGTNFFGNIKSQFETFVFHFFGDSKKRFIDADLHLANSKIFFDMFKKVGINEKKIVITGNPYWDKIFNDTQNLNYSKKSIVHKPIRVVILTNALVEHGEWSIKQKENFLRNLLNNLCNKNELEISLKIHPTSENISDYEELCKKFGIDVKIYQKESFWSIAENFDVMVTYGYTTLHSECALIGYRVVLFETNNKFRIMPFVNSAINSGFIQKCFSFDKITPIILELAKKGVTFNQEQEAEMQRILYKFDGKSGERAVNAILKLLTIKNN
jgi:hypothetical protein